MSYLNFKRQIWKFLIYCPLISRAKTKIVADVLSVVYGAVLVLDRNYGKKPDEMDHYFGWHSV